jgi:hypothetical protein
MRKPNTLGIIVWWLAVLGLTGLASAEPLKLTDQDLDRVAAGGFAPEFGMPSSAFIDRSTQITTHLSMPTSTAIAICLLCSGNASASAIANAIGVGQAGAISFSAGEGKSSAIGNAVAPFLIMLPQLPSGLPGKGDGGKK